MPTSEQIKQFLVLTALPVLSGSAATWLVIHLHFLAAFHLTAASIGGELTQLGVWGITAGLSWLASHNILKSVYSPAAKANVGGSLAAPLEFSSGKIKIETPDVKR